MDMQAKIGGRNKLLQRSLPNYDMHRDSTRVSEGRWSLGEDDNTNRLNRNKPVSV